MFTDESLRLVALRTVFPEMKISIDRAKKIDDSWPKKPKANDMVFPDTLAGVSVYQVIGGAMNEAESVASQDVVTGKVSNVRQVRFRLFRRSKENGDGLLVVLQCNFPDSSPAMSSPSIGLIVHLNRNAERWTVKDRYLLETVHHESLQGIRLLDLTGAGSEELVVESGAGGAGMVASDMTVFDLSKGHLDMVLDVASRMQYMTDDWYTRTLDLNRTRERRGHEFCFLKTTFFAEGNAFYPPQVNQPCYERGEGVDSERLTEQMRMLTPR